jgi:hypothetical protein
LLEEKPLGPDQAKVVPAVLELADKFKFCPVHKETLGDTDIPAGAEGADW